MKTFRDLTTSIDDIVSGSWILEEEYWTPFSDVLMRVIAWALERKTSELNLDTIWEEALEVNIDGDSKFFILWKLDEALQLEWALQEFADDLSEFERFIFEWIVSISIEQDTREKFEQETNIAKKWILEKMKLGQLPQSTFSTKMRKLFQWIIEDKRTLEEHLNTLIEKWIIKPKQIKLSPAIEQVLQEVKGLLGEKNWLKN